MFKVKIKQEIVDHCQKLMKQTNFGKRGEADGNQSEQLRGIVGQCVIMDMLKLPLMESNGFSDGGIDFIYGNKSYDVKTMGRNCDPKPYFVNNLIGLQKDYKVDRYIFGSINRQDMTMTICGWVNKEDFYKRANFFPKGMTRTRDDGTTFVAKTDLYELSNRMLNNVIDLDDLLFELKLN